MHPKLFASLLETLEKWTASVCETPEWENASIWWPEDTEMNMAKAAAAVYDATASASRKAEEETEEKYATVK